MGIEYSIHQLQYDELLALYIFDEISCPKITGDAHILNYDVVWWIGYITRKWVIDKGITSRDIINSFSFDDLVSAFVGFHTLDDDVAVDRLEEIKIARIKSQ